MSSISRNVRSVNCGELRMLSIGKQETLCGWAAKRRDHGGVIFIDLRDRFGLTQVVFDPSRGTPAAVHAQAERIRSEFVLTVTGGVGERPDGMRNGSMPTGDIELVARELNILSESKTPPFPIDDDVDVAETTRLKYRYLDLRRPELQKNFWVRHKLYQVVRRHLDEQGFLEVETPILYKSTPEGARDFLVPSRMNAGSFYALPQSPQTLKQILMISGFDRYFQIAKCFRDEDLRADRQPEFSQIDLELSFVDEELLFPIMEAMMVRLWKEVLGVDVPMPFPRMTYEEAMNRFGSDKPDVRFGLEIQNISAAFSSSTFQVFQSALAPGLGGKSGSIRCLRIEGRGAEFSRKDLDDLQEFAKTLGAKGLLYIRIIDGGEWQSPAAKFITTEEKEFVAKKLGLGVGDLLLVVADNQEKIVLDSLGSVRLRVAERLGLIPRDGAQSPYFLWVTQFPLLEYSAKDGRYYSCHHPFTSPAPEYFDDFVSGNNLDAIRASAYDLVLNGVEVGGGSLRIYRPDVQAKMFDLLGLTKEQAKERFGFFLEALEYGTPPHGGMAFGVDRLAAILCGVSAIRDVMAFPKTQRGHCLMSESPSGLEPEQLVELGLRTISVKN